MWHDQIAIGLSSWTRFRLRTLVVVVTVAAILLAIWARRAHFLRKAAYHRSQIVSSITIGSGSGSRGILSVTPKGQLVGPDQSDRDLWRLRLWVKYEKAAEQPWMPVAPDPPPPGEVD